MNWSVNTDIDKSPPVDSKPRLQCKQCRILLVYNHDVMHAITISVTIHVSKNQ